MTKFEYKEPEFNVVQANAEDVLTLSATEHWDTGRSGLAQDGTVGFTI